MVGLCLPQVRPSQTSKALARWEKISFAIFVNWKEILCQYIRWKSISLFLCRLTSQARATMRTSSLVPAWRSLLQVRILDILCWLDLSWQFWLCWSLSIPRHSPHFGRSFPLRSRSSRRYGVWRRSCGRQVKIKGNISWGSRSVGFTPTFYGQYHSDVTTEIFFRLYPPLSNIQEISVQIAKKVYTVHGLECCTLN